MMIPDLNTSCRLCFKNTGENDVTTAPSLYATIKDYYNVEIKNTDKYTKLICAECTRSVYAFYWHKKVVDAGQKLLADSIEMSEQMSHMKIEPQTDMDRSNATATVEKQEEDEEEDFDDTMTEGAPSPESAGTIPEPESQAMPPPVSDQPASQSIRERRSSVRGRRVSRSKERNEVWEIEKLQSNLNGDNGEAAIVPSRIRMRRQTTVVERPKSPKPAKSTKRRLSVMERASDFDSHRKLNRTAADTVTEMAPSKAKKMRLNSGVPEKQAEPESTPKPSKLGLTRAKSTPNRNHTIAPDTTSTTKTPTTAIVSSTPGKPSTILLTPANRLTPKQRDKKSKTNASSTPLITQFFSQASPLKCDECPAILNSRNELNFHMKIHKRGRCTKCKEAIDNNNRAESIQKHMISCLFLGNEIPRDYLTHLLKVKVDLDRLTPRKIDEIQKNLHPSAEAGISYRKKPGPKSWQRDIENRSDAQSGDTTMASQVTTKNTQKLTDKNGEKAAEVVKTANGDGDDDKPVTRKPRAKKTPSKSKNTNGEVNDEFQIAGGQTISLNWIDEAIKDKPFSLRNFETDKPIYNAIKSMPFSDALTKEKLATLIRTINLRKGSSVSLLKRNQNSHELTMPAQSAEIDANRPKSVENGVQSNTDNTVRHTPPNVTTVQPPLQSPNQAKAQNSPRTPGHLNLPQVSVVQPVSVISMAPPKASPTAANPPTAAIAAATPTLPQLLSLPTRVPMRTRTMSMCMSQSEYSQVAARLPSTRRQSICDNNQSANTNSPSALSKATALDHSYTNSLAAKTPESAKMPNRLNGVPYLPPPYMTKVHNADFLQARPTPPPAHMQPPVQPQSQAQPTASKTPQLPVTTLKVLTPDDLNSRAMNAAQPSQPSPNTRLDSPNSTENHASNVNNNNNQVSSTKRPRTKTTPLRPLAPAPAPASAQLQLDDDANISISVSLSRVGTGRAELILTLDNQRLQYDDLSEKRQQEVQQSLLKDDVWLQMLNHLKSIQPTNETLTLFEKILPRPQQDQFFSELKRVYGNRIG